MFFEEDYYLLFFPFLKMKKRNYESYMLVKISLLLIQMLFISCSNNDSFELLPGNESNEKIDLTIEKINIPLDTIGMTYYRKVSIFNLDSENYLIGLHKAFHSLDIYNIDKRQFIKRIVLEKRGPIMIQHIGSIYAINFDSILIDDYYSLVLMDTSGKVKKRIPLSEESFFLKNNIPYGDLTSTLNFGIIYRQKPKSVLLYYAPKNSRYYSDKCLKMDFLGELFLNKEKLTLLPLKYSRYYFNSKFGYGDMFQPNLTIYQDLVIYNFPVESNIYTYNLDTKTFNKYGAKSRFSKNLVEPFKKGFDPNQFAVKSTVFFKTVYDPYRELYYRLHWGNCDIKKNSVEFNTLYDKELYLMVFDNYFNVITEIELQSDRYLPFGYFVTNEGLFLSGGHPLNTESNSNYLQYDLFVFKKESK